MRKGEGGGGGWSSLMHDLNITEGGDNVQKIVPGGGGKAKSLVLGKYRCAAKPTRCALGSMCQAHTISSEKSLDMYSIVIQSFVCTSARDSQSMSVRSPSRRSTPDLYTCKAQAKHCFHSTLGTLRPLAKAL